MDYQDNFNQDIKTIWKYFYELKENFSKIDSDLAVNKQVSNILHDQMVQGECLEIVNILKIVSDDCLERMIFALLLHLSE